MDPHALRRWIENQRAVARRIAELSLDEGDDASAIAAALQLVALYGRLHGWPAPPDPISDREDEQVRARFATLRRADGLP